MLVSKKQKKLRHAEYYDMTTVFDNLYAESKSGKVFTGLMKIIQSEENIKLAYRNIKRNSGSMTAGADKLTIRNLEKISEDKFIATVQRKLAFYKPKPVRRVEIPKPNGKTRPLGIPAIWDRIVQQCILQVLEPICEAKFFERSNGFRPNRSTEHALAQCYKMVHQYGLHFVIDIDIKGFFDNVNHTKLKKQMWDMGIRDKQLLCIISEMLKAPIVMPDGHMELPEKGTPQGGLCSPLFSNIVLNELDWWIASQWENLPMHNKYSMPQSMNGTLCRGYINRLLKKSNLKEMYIIRYADDFKIFCRKRSDADKAFIAVKQWLADRLKLQINEEKSKVINLKRSYSEFLGFKLKAVKKNNSYAVKSHMSDKAIKRETDKLINQVIKIQNPSEIKESALAINLYNSMVWGIHNYYRYATHISLDCRKIARRVDTVLKNRMRNRLKRSGTLENGYIKEKYGMSKQIRFVNNRPICPIGYVQTKNPLYKKKRICKYTVDGREEIHKNLRINMIILHRLMRVSAVNESIEFMDNRISLFASQLGRCAVTKRTLEFEDIHCHHIIPKKYGGKDNYSNLIIVHKHVHMLLHAKTPETINAYLDLLKPNSKMLIKINKLRTQAELQEISL
ncbi:MAG: group II intron reverse transcriptase/maturase [Oscillospiraceae bacterium]|jgi:group II intron reverse transcriptase/maturase|nr:group II intron reverse transcriptase/maturase [Oscillospiraceae bacterium]